MKYIYYCLLSLCLASAMPLMAQETAETALPADSTPPSPWVLKGTPSLTFSQAYFTDSWKGGLNSLGFRAALLSSLTYKKDRSLFRSEFDLAFASTAQGNEEAFPTDFFTTEDRLIVNTSFAYKVVENKPWFYNAQVNFASQFAPGRNDQRNIVSRFAAPAFVISSLGGRYQSSFGLSTVVSPVASRMTIVYDTIFSRNVPNMVDNNNVPRRFLNEMGAYAEVNYTQTISKNILVITRLELFSDYQDNPQNIDIDWTTNVNFKISKFFSFLVFNRIVYRDKARFTVTDEETGESITKGPKVQWNESVNLGFVYNF